MTKNWACLPPWDASFFVCKEFLSRWASHPIHPAVWCWKRPGKSLPLHWLLMRTQPFLGTRIYFCTWFGVGKTHTPGIINSESLWFSQLFPREEKTPNLRKETWVGLYLWIKVFKLPFSFDCKSQGRKVKLSLVLMLGGLAADGCGDGVCLSFLNHGSTAQESQKTAPIHIIFSDLIVADRQLTQFQALCPFSWALFQGSLF